MNVAQAAVIVTKVIHLKPCFTIRYNKVLDKLKVDSDDLGSDLFNVK